MTSTMRAVEIDRFGGPEQLEMRAVVKPSPGPKQILVKVSFASVNAMDWKMVAGYRKEWVKGFPFRPGGDFSGIVEGVGEGADLPLGAEVFGPASGCYADYVVADAEPVAIKPRRVSCEDAATLPIAGLTAWQALHEDGALRAGQRVLVQGGSGGVGHFAVQLAKKMGAYVISTASFGNKEFVKSLGADEVFDYRSPFENFVNDIDLVIDGSGPETQTRCYGVLKPGGLLISLVGPPPAAPTGIRAVATTLRRTRAALSQIADAVEKLQLKPHIARVFPLVEAGAAQAFSHGKGRRGKVLLRVS